MADSPVGVASPNGTGAEDTFEQDLKEMLKDAPSLNDLSGPVQGGTMNTEGKPQAYIRPDSSAQQRPASNPAMPRSHTVPPATSTIPLSSPERNGQNGPDKAQSLVTPVSSKLDSIRAWSVNTYKFTRQVISERLGKGTRTVDLDLESQIESLRETQRKYASILHLARALSNHFYHVVQTQRSLGDTFASMSQKSPELQEEFSYNAETQKALCKNGEALIGALNFFTSSVNTLCHKTMEDTLQTIKQFETARVEYDAYRSDLDVLQNGPRDSNTMQRIDDAQKRFMQHKEKYDRLKGDVSIKLKFLDENRVTVTQKQLYLLQQAIRSYVAGNLIDLEALSEQFNLQPKYPVEPTPPSPSELN